MECLYSSAEQSIMSEAIDNLISMGAVERCNHENGEFISSIFLTPKKDGKLRFILNLKKLNEYIEPCHFKMEDSRSVVKLMTKGCFMATIDLKDAFYMLPMAIEYCKFLKFQYLGQLYKFVCLPFGLNIAPYVFTKVMKHAMGALRQAGHVSVIYLDDIWCTGFSSENCLSNIQSTIALLRTLGFIINLPKSNLIPCHQIKYLGFIFDSQAFSISLDECRKSKMVVAVSRMLETEQCIIREFAQLIGSLISICPAVEYSFLYTRKLERVKYLALLKSNQNYDSVMKVPKSIRSDLSWWKLHIPLCNNPIRLDRYDFTIFTDASNTGWGAACNGQSTHGYWTAEERKSHINFLELMAVWYGLKCYANNACNSQILLRVDNATALSYVNKMGGIKFQHLADLAQNIWRWCEIRKLWIHASYIPSAENAVADSESRSKDWDKEWKLNHSDYTQICLDLGKPNIDLFASRTNTQCSKFISWKPDPEAWAVDAFTVSWKRLSFYAFPPFALIGRVLQKIINDEAEGILVVPNWPSQPWFPVYMSLVSSKIYSFGPSNDLLISSFRISHPLSSSLTLVAAKLSGKHS